MDDEPNPVIEALYRASPLLAFSPYTHMQSNYVRELGREIIEILNESVKGATDMTINGDDLMRAYAKFWFWTLGSYEILRTMGGPKSDITRYFNVPISSELKRLKSIVRKIRVPFAKQEYAGRCEIIRGEASMAGFGKGDMIFDVEGVSISAADLIRDFDRVFASITLADVRMPLKGFTKASSD